MRAIWWLAALTGASCALDAQDDSLLGPGVSKALAEYRAARLSAVRYDLTLDVQHPDTARGDVAVRFVRRGGGDVIVDFRGPSLADVRVNGVRVARPDVNGAHLRVPQGLLRRGENVVTARFTTLIAAAGASIIKVRDPADSATYLYTLLVPADANQLFPCFDQPDLKARTRLTLVTPAGWKAVANGRKARAVRFGGQVAHTFLPTEPISTYLIAFAAGPWVEFRTAASKKPITLYVRGSRAAEVEADSIILANDRAATWLEDYFATPFPFQKLDMVLAPAFPFGGMEHPGAIFYSEERFIYRERPTLPQRLGRTSTIYHEVAHQWFGDLVTMRWFDDLWLKEGFSTYMAAKMQDAMNPASDSWKTFYLSNKPSAYAVDATEGTTPVWQELGNLDQAKSNYGAIVYNKAPGILKQLNYLVGDSAFQAGLRRFLKRHAYANAGWADLLSAIGDASGRDLRPWGDAYILRRGMPIIEQQLRVTDGRIAQLTLVQRPAQALSGSAPWPIRLEVLMSPSSGAAQRVVLSIERDTVVVPAVVGQPAPAFVYANSRDFAYALVMLDSASVGALERGIGAITDSFLRAQLWGALWDLVREARWSPERFVALALRELPAERDEQIINATLARLTRASGAFLSDAQRARWQPQIEHVLLQRVHDAAHAYAQRKPFLDAFIRVAATPAAHHALDAMLDSAQLAGAPVAPATRWAVVTRLQTLAAPSASRRLDAEVARDRTPEGARRAFVARVARPDAATRREYFARYFQDRTLNEDWATASLAAFNAPEVHDLSRPFLGAALDSLPWIQQHRRIFYLGSWLSSFVEGQRDEEAVRTIRRFLETRSTLGADLRSKVLQALDELERTVRIRRAFAEPARAATLP